MNVTVLFRGLLHFIENASGNARVKVCAVLPEAPGHFASVYACKGTKLLRDGRSVADVDISGKRVALRFPRAVGAPAQTGPVFEQAVMRQTTMGAVAMEDILGRSTGNTDRNLAVVSRSPSPSSGVHSQVLIGEGVFTVLASSGPPHLDLPGDLTGLGIQRITMSEKIQLNAANLARAEIIVFSLTGSTTPEAIYTIESCEDPAMVQIEYLCKPDGSISFQDNDFRHHYRLLARLPAGRVLDSMPVPTIARFSSPSNTPFDREFFEPRDFQQGGCNCAGARGLSRPINLDMFM